MTSGRLPSAQTCPVRLFAAGACVTLGAVDGGDPPMFPGADVMFFIPEEKVPLPVVELIAFRTVDQIAGDGGACINSPAIQVTELFVGSTADPK